MWDGSAVPVDENLEIAERLLEKSVEAKKLLEIEVGVVGGEEDGVAANVSNEKLFSTPEDGLKTAAKLGLGERGRYLTALTFGNVHGVYKPGNVKQIGRASCREREQVEEVEEVAIKKKRATG